MPSVKEEHISKTEKMKQASYGFPEVMNKTEACFYLWRSLNLNRLQYLIDTGKIRVTAEDGREVITKKELDKYTDSLYSEKAA